MDLDAALEQLANAPSAPLDPAELALLLARDEYPDLNVAAYLGQFDRLGAQVRPSLRGGLEASKEDPERLEHLPGQGVGDVRLPLPAVFQDPRELVLRGHAEEAAGRATRQKPCPAQSENFYRQPG